jgi:predicted transcriptional regulator
MRLIQNKYIGFRIPEPLKEKLSSFAIANDLHLSQVIRSAVVEFLNVHQTQNKTWNLH